MSNVGLQYSSDASAARYLFYQDINEINIFVEDADKEYEYETIFNRLLDDKYKIKSILSAGGKNGVRKKFDELGCYNSSNPKIKNFYIVDGDFNRFISSEDMVHCPNFIYLEAYNIENYLIDENATIQFCKGRLKKLDNEVIQIINFRHWKTTILRQANKIFLLFAVIQKTYPDIPTTSIGYGKFLDEKSGFESCDSYYKDLYNIILQKNNNIDSEIEAMKHTYECINNDDFFNLICGKFLFKSLCWYIRSIFNSKFHHQDFRWHLINNFDIKKLNYIKNTIDSVVAN